MHITGIDIGGSHITIGMIDKDTFSLSNESIIRRKIDCHADAETILNNWCNTIKDAWNVTNVQSAPLAIAMPGPFDYKNGICLIKGFGKYESLYKINIREELSKRLNILSNKILFRNDAEAFLEGELKAGAAKGFSHAIGMTLGTGMGTAKSHKGITEDAEMSFKVLIDSASIEEYISTRGLLKTYFEATGIQLPDVKALAAMHHSDANARKAFEVFAHHLYYLLKQFIEEEQPEVVVIGGNIANAWDLFMPSVIQNLSLYFSKMPIITKASLGETAAIIGAAVMFDK